MTTDFAANDKGTIVLADEAQQKISSPSILKQRSPPNPVDLQLQRPIWQPSDLWPQLTGIGTQKWHVESEAGSEGKKFITDVTVEYELRFGRLAR